MNKGQYCLLVAFTLFLFFGLTTAEAQERFTVQSGGRGLENAKQAAQIRQIQVKDGQQDNRLDAIEGDIDRIAPQAWQTIAQCGVGAGASGTGYKITWNPSGNGSWGCIQETDPTVKTFAKTDLPACSAGQVLRADGTRFICTTSAGSSGFEVDPYVQDFARNTAYTINACAADEVLTMTNKRLNCVKSRNLAIAESDPTVQPFAKAALPNCAAGQLLTTAISGSTTVLRCVANPNGGRPTVDYGNCRFALSGDPNVAGQALGINFQTGQAARYYCPAGMVMIGVNNGSIDSALCCSLK